MKPARPVQGEQNPLASSQSLLRSVTTWPCRDAASSGTAADSLSDPSTFRIDSGSWIAASTRLLPPHLGQSISRAGTPAAATPPTSTFAAAVARGGACKAHAEPAAGAPHELLRRRPPRHRHRHRHSSQPRPVRLRQPAAPPDAAALPAGRRRRKHPVIRHQVPTRPDCSVSTTSRTRS